MHIDVPSIKKKKCILVPTIKAPRSNFRVNAAPGPWTIQIYSPGFSNELYNRSLTNSLFEVSVYAGYSILVGPLTEKLFLRFPLGLLYHISEDCYDVKI